MTKPSDEAVSLWATGWNAYVNSGKDADTQAALAIDEELRTLCHEFIRERVTLEEKVRLNVNANEGFMAGVVPLSEITRTYLEVRKALAALDAARKKLES